MIYLYTGSDPVMSVAIRDNQYGFRPQYGTDMEIWGNSITNVIN